MELVYRLGWTLMHSLWEGAAVAAIAAIVLTTIPRRAAHARYFCLLLAMLGMQAAFAITLIVAPDHLPSNQVVTTEKPLAMVVPILPSAEIPPVDLGPPRATLVTAVPLHSASSDSGWIEKISPWAVDLWLIGVLLLGLWRSAVWLSIQRLRVAKTALAEVNVLQTAQRLAGRLNMAKPFDVLLSGFVETPMVIGWLRPIILLPASAMSGLSPEQLEGILAHELAHISRHDYLMNLLQIVVETLLFYHPAIWWMSGQVRLEREQACDDVAISVCGNRHEYASSLAALEELRLTGSAALAASGSGGRQMVVRIRRILQTGDDAPRWGLPTIVSFLLIASTTAVLFSQSRPASDGKSLPAQPFSLRNDAPGRSAFTAVRWRGDVAEVQFKNTWYELDSINNKSVEQIMAYLTNSKDFAPRKHFAEDLVEVLRDMGDEPGNTVKLELKTLDTQQVVTITDAPMTEDNRRSVLEAGRTDPPTAPLVPNRLAATAPANAGGDPAARVRNQSDPERKRLADLKARYEIELRQAQQEVKDQERNLVDLGGTIPSVDSSPKSMELNRWVQEQIELKTQKLTIDTELSLFADKKTRGEIPPSVAQEIERNPSISRASDSVESLQSRLDEALATRNDTNPEVVNLQVQLKSATAQLADSQKRVTEQSLKDYEADLNWRRDNLAQRLARIDELVAQLKQEVGEINMKTADLTSRKDDIAVYRELAKQYSLSLEQLDEKAREADRAEQAGGTSQPAKPPGN